MIELKTKHSGDDSPYLAYDIFSFPQKEEIYKYTGDNEFRIYLYDADLDDVFFLEKTHLPFIKFIKENEISSLNEIYKRNFFESLGTKTIKRKFLNSFNPIFYLDFLNRKNSFKFSLVRKKQNYPDSSKFYYKYSVILKCELSNEREFQEHLFKYFGCTSFNKFYYVTLFSGANDYSGLREWENGIDIFSNKECKQLTMLSSNKISKILNNNF